MATPNTDAQYRLLKAFTTEFEAELVRTKLREEGIETYLQAEDMGNVFPSLEYSNGMNVYVEPADYDRATALVNSIAALPDDADVSGESTDGVTDSNS